MIFGYSDYNQDCIQYDLVVKQSDKRVLKCAPKAAGCIRDQENVANECEYEFYCLNILHLNVVTLASAAQST